MQTTRRSFLAQSAAVAAALGPVRSALGQTHAPAAGPGNRGYYKGVQLGVQTYSFHEILNDGAGHADEIIRDMKAVEIGRAHV